MCFGLFSFINYLSVSKLVLVMVNIQRPKKFLSSLPAVNELTIRDGSGIQDAISGKEKEKIYCEIILHFLLEL